MLSIAVDPALTFNLFRVFAALACIAISGLLLVYFAFGIRHPLTAFATALPTGEPYVLYFTMFRPAARVQSMPVAWITYDSEQEPTVLLAPRFILFDQAPTQD